MLEGNITFGTKVEVAHITTEIERLSREEILARMDNLIGNTSGLLNNHKSLYEKYPHTTLGSVITRLEQNLNEIKLIEKDIEDYYI